VRYDHKWTDERELFLPYTDAHHFVSANTMFKELLKSDHDIKSLICRWIKDATEYQAQANERLHFEQGI
jgi:hypothetical protein